MAEPWYPSGYCAHYGQQWCTPPYDGPPHYPNAPTIQIHDVAVLRFKPARQDFWKAARKLALDDWRASGLILPVLSTSIGYDAGMITLDCVDIPDVELGGWAGFGMAPITEDPLPGVGWVQVERPEFEKLFQANMVGSLRRIIAHEIGHTFGFSHGGTGVMAVPGPNRPNAEELEAVKELWL